MKLDKVLCILLLCLYMADNIFSTGLATIGQALGLPEMTLSERLAGTTQQTSPAYTGSGLLGSGGYVTTPTSGNTNVYDYSGGVYTTGPNAGQQVGSGGQGTTGQVAGASTGGSSTPYGQSTAGGSVRPDSRLEQLSKMDRNPKEDEEYKTLLAQQGPSQDEINRQINDVYNPTMDYLNQAEGAVKSDFPNVLDAAQKAYELAIGELTGSKNKNLTTIGENSQQAVNRKEDALTSARRLYDELRRGYSQKFGGSTSAGQAATELASVEQQRQMGATNRQYADTARQIDQQKVQLEQDYSLGQQKIIESKNQAIAQANRDFQNKLLEIQGKRAETESAKAQAKLGALQELRNRAYQAQQEALTYQRNLDMFYKQQQADLETYAQKLQLSGQGSSSAVNNFLSGTTTSPTSSLQVGQSGQQTTNPALTGIMGTKKDELTGSIQQKVDPYNLQKMLYGN